MAAARAGAGASAGRGRERRGDRTFGQSLQRPSLIAAVPFLTALQRGSTDTIPLDLARCVCLSGSLRLPHHLPSLSFVVCLSVCLSLVRCCSFPLLLARPLCHSRALLCCHSVSCTRAPTSTLPPRRLCACATPSAPTPPAPAPSPCPVPVPVPSPSPPRVCMAVPPRARVRGGCCSVCG